MTDRASPHRSESNLEIETYLARQNEQWQLGNYVLIEDLLGSSDLERFIACPDQLMLLVCQEVALRESLGETITLESYQSRFPRLADQLAIQWEIDELIRVNTISRRAVRTTQNLAPGAEVDANCRTSSRVLPANIDRYEIVAELGRGGVGVVYEAWDPRLRRRVAIKKLRSGGDASHDDLQRIRSEAEAIANIKHPNVVQIYDVADVDGEPYLAMELCTGGNLAKRLDSKPLLPRQAAELVKQIAAGVAAAHANRIIHRDLKPSNVLLESQDNWLPKVTDFGLAKMLDGDALATASGNILGTPAYMPPEQATGHSVQANAALDVYALGAILYECLTGRPPFRAATVGETLDLVRKSEPISIRRLEPKVPIDLETIAYQCLRKEPEKRYDSIEAFQTDLESFLAHRPIKARRMNVFERTIAWTLRNPSLAASLGALAIILAGSITLLTWMNWKIRDEAEKRSVALEERIKALQEKSAALLEREEAYKIAVKNEQLAKHRYYNARINVAQQAFYRKEMARAEDLVQPFEESIDIGKRFEWKLLRDQLLQSLLWTNRSNEGEISSIDFSGNGEYLLTAGGNLNAGSCRLYHASTGKILLDLPQSAVVNACCFSANDERFALGIGNGQVRIYETASGKLLQNTKEEINCKSMLWSPDGKYLFVGDERGKLACLQADPLELVRIVQAEEGPILRMFFSSDENALYTSVDWGAKGRHSTRWSFRDGQITEQLEYTNVSLSDTSADDSKAVGMSWGELVLVDVESGVDVQRASMDNGPLLAVYFNDESDEIILATRNGRELRFLSGSDLSLKSIFQTSHALSSIAFDKLRQRCCTGDTSGQVRLWQTHAQRTPVYDSPNGVSIKFAQFKQNSNSIVYFATEEALHQVDLVTQEATVVRELSNVVLMSRDGKTIICKAEASATSSVFHVWKEEASEPIVIRVPYVIYQQCMLLSESGRWLALRGEGMPIDVYDLHTDKNEPSCRLETLCWVMSFSKDETMVAAGEQYGSIAIFNLADGSKLQSLSDWRSFWAWGFGTCFSSDGKYLACGNESGRIDVWDCESSTKVAQLSGNQGEVLCLKFFPDDRRLLTGGSGDVRIWDVESAQEVISLPSPEGEARQLAISDDGNAVLVRTRSDNLRVWHTR